MVPKGVKDGEKFVFEGQGNLYPKETPGNVHIVIKAKEHPEFRRDGADLYFTQKISFVEALTGVNFTFKHLNSKTVRVKTEVGKPVKGGTQMTLLNYGMPFYHDGNNFGNLFVTFEIDWPEVLTPGQVQGLKTLFRTPQQDAANNVREDEVGVLEKYKDSHKNPFEEGGVEPPLNNDQDGEGAGGAQCSNQ